MLISNAYAQAAGGDPTNGLMGLLPLVLMFVVLWFLMIRPQMKRAKEHKALVEALTRGDEVVTGGGIAGRVAEVGVLASMQVEIANTEIAIQNMVFARFCPRAHEVRLPTIMAQFVSVHRYGTCADGGLPMQARTAARCNTVCCRR